MSTGGALLEGDEVPAERELDLWLVLPDRQPIEVSGEVIRRGGADAGRGAPASFAIRFGGMREDVAQVIEQTIDQTIDRGRHETRAERSSAVALLCDSCGSEARILAGAMRSLGYRVITARTPLDAILQLQDPSLAIDTVVLGPSMGSGRWREMAAFLADAYPQLRRILVARGARRRRRQAEGLVHAVVGRPWTPDVLRDALI